MNPVRIAWIAQQAESQLGSPPCRLLDIGCGAGLAAEALANLGFDVLGIDASPAVIEAAKTHAASTATPARRLAYRAASTADLLAGQGEKYDIVTALEVIEHVTHPENFLCDIASLIRPGGMAVISTLNRSLSSLAVAKIGAEYMTGIVPRGTHDWRQFLKPDQLAAMARHAGLRLTALAGLTMNPISGRFRISGDVSINYIAAFADQ
jgi:2-polyprenyl-6-hydroxyphenyl methylase/3-demethylubiquinone-9 3-methyltransferase